MDFLRLLEGARTPFISALLSAITYVGDETVFMVIAVAVFWCVSKRQGYYIFAASLGGTVVNQWLKLIFRIPRPWALDPSFTIVESARAAATGYSFPSGHTQNAVGTLGALALANRQSWLRGICIVLIVLVPFSRMYLGVHTPLDVGVSFVIAVVLVLALRPCYRDEVRFARANPWVLCAMLALALGYAVWVNVAAFPADVDAENLGSGVKNAWTLLGCVLGLMVSYVYDTRKLHFDVRAPFPAQLLKVGLGFALLLAIRVGAKALLTLLAGDAVWLNAVRYFLMVVFAGCLWPMTFPFFSLHARKEGAS